MSILASINLGMTIPFYVKTHQDWTMAHKKRDIRTLPPSFKSIARSSSCKRSKARQQTHNSSLLNFESKSSASCGYGWCQKAFRCGQNCQNDFTQRDFTIQSWPTEMPGVTMEVFLQQKCWLNQQKYVGERNEHGLKQQKSDIRSQFGSFPKSSMWISAKMKM